MAGRKSLFSVFFGGSKPEANPVAQAAKAEDENEEPSVTGSKEIIESTVEVGGAKGWTTSATALLYHKASGMICVGTEGGAIHVYGDGFQFARTWLTDDPNEVVAIVPLFPNKILTVFGDNSMVAMELPSLEVIDLLSSSWLPRTFGDITAVHCDTVGEKNFVYLGTSEGVFIVLDVMESMIRVCEFQLSKADFGLGSKDVSISDIQISPKDEKFIGVGFEGGDLDEGYVVIYDLVKHKVHKSFTVPSVSTMAWHHSGDFLYAGTRKGELYIINVEKSTCLKTWSAEDELISSEDDGEEAWAAIRRISWLAPQKEDEEGCLFLMLANNGADNDNLQNVIIGLSPSSSHGKLRAYPPHKSSSDDTFVFFQPGDMSTAFALPPIQGEKLISFRVIPTYDKDTKSAPRSETDIALASPGLLLLTQRHHEVDKNIFERDLKIIRCPTGPICQWGLEIGTLPEPRRAREVQPTSSDISVVAAVLPRQDNPMSLGSALIIGAGAGDEQVVSTATGSGTSAPSSSLVTGGSKVGGDHDVNRTASKRLSYRALLENIGDMEAQLSSLDDWELVMVNGEHNEVVERDGSFRKQDVVFVGQKDGSVIAFGVSLPLSGREIGRGGIWLPLAAMRCGMTTVTALHTDEDCGMVVAGDEAGFVALYQIYDEDHRMGAVDVLHRLHDKMRHDIDMLTQDSSTVLSLEDFNEDQSLIELKALSRGLHFSKIKEVFRTRITGQVTATHVIGEFLLCFVGTEDGSILVNSDLRTNGFVKVENISTTGASGSVKGFHFGYFAQQDILITALYAFFESGHVVVIDVSSMSIVAFNVSLKLATMENENEADLFDGTVEHMVILSQNDDGQVQVARKPTLSSHLYCLVRRRADRSPSATPTVDSNSSGGDVTPPNKGETSPKPTNSRLSFFARKAVAQSTTNSTNTSPVPAPPSTSGITSSGVAPPLTPLDEGTGGHASSANAPLKFAAFNAPRQLVFAHGNLLCTFSLDKFLAPKRRESFTTVAKGVAGVSLKKIVDNKIVASGLMKLYTEDPSDYYAYLSCLDNTGTFRLVSLQSRSVVNVSGLLEGMAEESTVSVYGGALLPNGSNYVVNHGTMIYSSYVILSDCHVRDVLPDRANPTARAIHKSLTLLHGREGMLAKQKNDAKKRRSSVMSLTTSAPTDLYKIFAKSRDQRLTDNLFGGADRGAPSDDNAARRSTKTANKMTNDLAQLRENFVERGERINRIALKMDDFKDTAAQFKQTAAAHKERLKQKNQMWGLF